MSFRFYDHPAGVESPSVTSLLGGISEERLYNWRLRNALKYVKDNNIDLSERKAVDITFDIVQDLSVIEADQGKWIHLLAEFYFAGRPTDILYEPHSLLELIPDAVHNVLLTKDTLKILEKNFYKFIASIGKYTVIESEKEIHGVLDGPNGEPGYFSGTIDTILQQIKAIILLDFKSGRDTYDNHVAQVAAYGYGYNNEQKMLGNPIKVTDLWVVRLGRTENAEPFHILKIKGQYALRGLQLFHTSLNLWYQRSGRWGDIMPSKEEEF